MKNLQKIYESQNSIIYKGKYQDFENDVLIKILNDENPSEEKINRFNNEFEFTKDLEINGVRKVLKKDKKDGKNILILEYFEGQNLKKFFSQKSVNFLKKINIVSNISQTLGEIHEQNIIHKDINSNNILIDENHKICIIDFGIATKYKLKNQELSNIDNLEGTITHISPEQTGRINRTVDYRSDLYSFGIILYEMFTGKLPFEENNNMEILHSHITKIPISPHKINSEIPEILSQIILKLLAKNAEDRYQSAFGLKHDLQQLSKSSKLLESSFKLGEKDFSGKLSIPEKLYGRENEIKKLFEIYENVSNAKKELLLISGLSGVGKSVLIHEIHKPLTKKNGFYIEGKFDQFQKDIPYFAIIQAFTDFANIILKENDENLKYWKNLIQKSVGNVGGVLTNLIPEFELIIGKQKELPKLEGKEIQNRFNYVWLSFVKAISNKKHPLIIFIDDLQWADNASVELLKLIVNDNEIKYFFPIIAYRDNEINDEDLQEFTNLENVNISNIQLGNLKQEDVNNLLKDALSNPQNFQNLANLIFSKTHGNAFFTVQFLTNLYEEEFLKFDFTENIWNWDFEKIKKQNISDNVVELMKNKIHKLPKNTQDILKIASCIGNRFDIKILSKIYKTYEKTAKNILKIAILENFIFPIDNQNFKFVHDKIQQAIYSTIPEKEKNILHLKTGKLLLGFLDKKSLERRIFDVVNQLNFGKNLIENDNEKQELAELNYKAGLKAKLSSAYFSSYNYMKIGLYLLDNFGWLKCHQLTLNMQIEAAETSFLYGNLEEMNKLVDISLKHSKNVIQEAKIRRIRILANIGQQKQLKAVNEAIILLNSLGVSFPKKPGTQHTILNLLKTKYLLWRIKSDSIKNSQRMKNENMLASMQIMADILSASYYTNANLFPLIVFKLIKLTIKYGIDSKSAVAFITYGFLLGILGDLKGNYEYGKLGTSLLEKLNEKKNNGQAYTIYNVGIGIWHKKVSKIIIDLLKNSRIALETGDLEFAISSSASSFSYSFYKGKQLKNLFSSVKKYKIQFSKSKEKNWNCTI